MKKYLLFAPAFILFSCSGDAASDVTGEGGDSTETTVIIPPFEGDFKNDTVFVIDPTKETIVETPNGSSIEIPANILVDEKGKQRKKYKLCDMMTPYDKLKSIEGAQQYLKPGVTFKMLDDIAEAMSDNQVADHLQEQRGLLFKNIHEDYKVSA